MKIVHCFFTMKTGGAQMLAVDLLNEMSRMNNDVYLIVINNKWDKHILDLLDKGVKVYLLNRKEGSKNITPLLKLNYLLWKIKPDIVHAHEVKIVNAILWKNSKLIHTIHDVGKPNSFYKKYDALVSISSAVYADVRDRFGLNTEIVNNGIASTKFVKRKTYNLRHNQPFKIVQISRLVHNKKGQDILLKAVGSLLAQGEIENIQLDFIGAGESLSFLSELSKSLKMEAVVNFLGEKNRSWVNDNLHKYDLLVQPSIYEGFGLTVVEGFAAGLPVLASDIEGPAEIIAKTSQGFLFEVQNVKSLELQLKYIIDLYKANKMNDIMTKDVNVTTQLYSIDNCVKKYFSIYQKLKATV